jgi:hypothetical protein
MVTEVELRQSPDLTALDFCSWGWIKSEVHKRTVDTRDELLAHILDTFGRTKKLDDSSDEDHATFAHELQSATRLTVGFSNVYYKP